VTVKVTALLAMPLTVTMTDPVVTPVGTGTTMELALQLVGVAAVPLNRTVLVPGVAPKFDPVIVTTAPIDPDVGERLEIAGPCADVTVNVMPLLMTLLTVTATDPVVAPLGTGATILLALQLLGVAAVPLNLMLLVPCDVPKFAPLIVTEVPTPPDAGDRLTTLGVAEVRVRTVDTSAEYGLFSPAVFTACAAKKYWDPVASETDQVVTLPTFTVVV
jgi:hypothetical protein